MSPERRHHVAVAIKSCWSWQARDRMPSGAKFARHECERSSEQRAHQTMNPAEHVEAKADLLPPLLDEQRLMAEIVASPPRDSYALEPDSGHRVAIHSGQGASGHWRAPSHLRRYRPALHLQVGDALLLPPLNVKVGDILRARFASGEAAQTAHSLAIAVDAVTADGNRCLFQASVNPHRLTPEPEIQVALISLPQSAEHPLMLRVRCLDGNGGAPSTGGIVLLELAIGPADEIDLIAARAFRELRIANERQHFSQAYDHPMYVSRAKRTRLGVDALIPSERSFGIPGAIENAFDYALARLCRRLHQKAPNFEHRLRTLAERWGRLSILSVGTGQGLVEAALFQAIRCPIEVTIVDVDEELLRRAVQNMPTNVSVARQIVADANALPQLPNGFDIAICVSGVHHLIELSTFFRNVRDALRESGELWLIGEQIGLNGNRLEEAALARANQIFTRLPERLRRNFYTGRTDASLSNPDQSDATFEGIRSEAIEQELGRFFVPRHVSRRDCILWRMVWPEYVVNYSLQRSEDLEILDWLVEEEVDYFLSGGRPTELHGVYVPLCRSAQ
jgi:SAM-dependent methyltransferase